MSPRLWLTGSSRRHIFQRQHDLELKQRQMELQQREYWRSQYKCQPDPQACRHYFFRQWQPTLLSNHYTEALLYPHQHLAPLLPTPSRGQGGRVVTLSPPTSEAGVRSRHALSGKAGSCLSLVGSLQYRTLMNCMYWFPLPFQLPVMI